MSLSLSLNNALSGINVAQRSLAVLANNVANANTAGYTRQVASLSPNVTGTQGSGALVEDIVRKIDEYLVSAIRLRTSETTQTEVISEYYDRMQIMLGQPGADNTIDEYIENFFNTMQSLAETPELTSFRYEAVNSGLILAREMSALAGGLEDLRYQADQDIQDTIALINSELLRLDETNAAIHRAVSLGDPLPNLLDRRDMSLQTLSEYLDIRVNESDSGQVYVYTTGGVALLEHIPYQLVYDGITSIDTLTSDSEIPQITVDGYDDGEYLGRPEELVSSGVNTDITTTLTGGQLKGLLDLRDQELPRILQQLDLIASELRDQFNAIHNAGSGLPAASLLTGTRAVLSNDAVEWTGTVRIAAVNEDGSAVTSRYGNEDSGFLPLDLDLDALRSDQSDPNLLTVEVLMREINEHFTPQNKAQIGNLNNIEIAAMSDSLPDGTDFVFDFELENISDTDANFWVTGVTVLDDAAVNISAVTSTYPVAVALDAANTFTTTIGSDVVTVQSTGHGLSEGDVIYLDGVTGPTVDNIPVADLNGQAFTISNVSANTFDIEVVDASLVVTGVAVPETGTALGAAATQSPGGKGRTSDNGDITLDLSGNLLSTFYTVQVDVMVEDSEGNLTTATVDYRINNNQSDVINTRFAASAVNLAGISPGGALEVPISTRALVRAQLVDENGDAVADGEEGYLQIEGRLDPLNPDEYYTIVIDDMTSEELGRPNISVPDPGSNRGFSHFFGLNDFFVANEHNDEGDTVEGSALAMAVRDDILENPNLISMGSLTQTPPPADSDLPPYYTYERTVGDNSVAQELAALGLTQLTFDAAGGLPTTIKTFNGYASEVLGFVASKAANAEATYEDNKIVLDGFQERMDAISGVNIDEEMANTIIFQNAYSASAQVIRTVKELFDTLLASF